jgi:hypothetical protein
MLGTNPQEIPAGSPPLPRNLTIHSVVHNQDLIPRCSMHEFVNMLAALDAIDKCAHWTATDRAAMLIRGILSEEELLNVTAVLEACSSGKELAPSEDFQLIIPGHLYWLLPRAATSNLTINTTTGNSSTSGGGSSSDTDGSSGRAAPALAHASSYSLVRMRSCEDIFTGHLFTGDSMFQDHLAGSYKRAMLSIDTRLDRVE